MNKKQKTRKPHPIRHTIGALFTVVFLVLTLALNVLLSGSIAEILNAIGSNALSTSASGEDVKEVARQMEMEGAVLLQNRDRILPLPADIRKVNVFGWASTQWLGGGSGSGGVAEVRTDFLAALNSYGIETNPELTEMYRAFQSEREFTSTLNSWPEQSARLYEPSVSDSTYYSESLLSNAKSYSDTAFVVIGRLLGESNDGTKVQYKRLTAGGNIVTDESRTLLELSTEEEELLGYVAENYENVIVLINSGNVMALGPVETIPGVDAVVMAGETGSESALALPPLIWGEANFSGKTADTWAYDLSTAASYANAGSDGIGAYSGADGLYPANGTPNGNLGEPDIYFQQVSYIDYAEGIYVGYKWYETADAEGYWDDISNEYGTGYDGIVQYPFGYGLSYTDFSWEQIGTDGGISANGDSEIVLTVRVTNIGSAAGKDVVELYSTPPYTPGGIEKASVNLITFEKTRLLQPGESEDITLRFHAEDLASYDAYDANGNGFAGWELEPGAYEISIRKDAHTPVATITVQVDEGARYGTDSVTGNPVGNKFTGQDAMDGFSVDGSDSGQNITYLTRTDFKGTFPYGNVGSRPMDAALAGVNLYTEEMATAWADENAPAITTGAKNGLKIVSGGKLTELGYKLGKDYDSPEWDALLDQLTEEEMVEMVTHAYSHIGALPSVGKPATGELDGPSQVGGFVMNRQSTGFPNIATMACTWDKELLRDFGLAIAKDAISANLNGLYAPSTNIHRSPFNGRNYEYYSEDGILAGHLCGNMIAGAKNGGVYCFIKHFINNDGESYIYRDSVYLWETEQALREIYLEPFRIAIEHYGATGLMSSYNRLGAVWTGGSGALLTGVLRDEWNFKGAVITDFSDHQEFMNGDQMIRAGGDIWMDGFGGSLRFETSSNRMRMALREAAKHVIYQFANAAAEKQDYLAATGDTSVKAGIITPVPYTSYIKAVFDVLTVLFLFLSVRGFVVDHKIRKQRKAEQQTMNS